MTVQIVSSEDAAPTAAVAPELAKSRAIPVRVLIATHQPWRHKPMPADSRIDPRRLRVPGKPQVQDAPSDKPDPAQPPESLHEPSSASASSKMPSPFHPHSLIGTSKALLARAIDPTPLLGDFVMHGQSTMIYAKANAGKTLTAIRLIIDAVEEGRVQGDDVLYINADDSSKGLADKVELTERHGIHMLAPGYKGFNSKQFADKLRQSAEDGSARGRVIFIDTLKKFTTLMDKTRCSEFTNVCREAVAAGATVIAFGHTAKNPNADGTPRYQGVTDILDDFDAVYVAEALTGQAGTNERIIRFTMEKSRADCPQVSAYAYSTERGISYQDKLASVRPLYPEELDGASLELDQLNDEQIIAAIRGYLISGHGHVGKDKMIRALARDGDISRGNAERVLDKYTGSDPERHLWDYEKGERGKRTYYLHKAKSAVTD